MKRITIWPFLFLIMFVTTACGRAQSDRGASGSQQEQNQSSPTHNAVVTFIELGSVNCVPCRAMQPVMQSVRDRYGDRVDVFFYDVWTPEGEPYAVQYGIRVIPTQVFLDANGVEYYRHEGFFPEEELFQVLYAGGVRS